MLAADPLFKIYALSACILSLQMLFLGGLTAGKRAKHGGYMNPEDHKVSFKGARLIEGAEHPEVARIQRAHRNLLESLPLFLGLGMIAVFAGVSPLGGQICVGVFTVARVLHSIVYIRELQPWRTMFYALGAFALLGLVVEICLALL